MYGNSLQIFASSSGIFFVLAELGCYLVIFHDIHTQDSGSIRNLLSEDVIRKRNKKNAITFLGQFYGFCTEFVFIVLWTIVLILGKSHKQLKALSLLVKFIEFGVLSVVEVLTDHEIRNEYVEGMVSFVDKLCFMVNWFF